MFNLFIHGFACSIIKYNANDCIPCINPIPICKNKSNTNIIPIAHITTINILIKNQTNLEAWL